MNVAQQLYDAARHYCINRHAYWCTEYQKLMDQRQARIGSGYSKKAYDIFPRYHALAAILTEIERIDAESLPKEAELRELLTVAGYAAESMFTQNPNSEIEATAIADERQELERAVRAFTPDDLARVQPLPYRRVLSAEEVATLWARIKQRWSADGSYFYPLSDRTDPTLRAFATNAFDDRFPPSELRQILHSKGVNRVYELREYGDNNYHLDVDAWEPYYDGAEGFWFSDALDWIMYCSHESSITVGGVLVDPILSTWKDASKHEWALTLNG